jgi:hypothetical protein
MSKSPDKKTLKLMGRLLAMPHKPHVVKKASKRTAKKKKGGA